MNKPSEQIETTGPASGTETPSPSIQQRHAEARTLLFPLPSIILLAWLIRVSALINLVSSLFPHELLIIRWLEPWMPFEISDGIRIRMFLTSLLLFVLASGLERGKRLAWLLTVATLAVTPLLHLGRAAIWPQALINFCLIAFLFAHRRYFIVRSDRRSVRTALLVCSLLTFALLAFGTMRLHDLRDETSGDDDWGACLQTAFELVLAQNTVTQQPQTMETYMFFSILRVSGLSIALVGLYLTLRPVLVRRKARDDQREKVEKLVEHYGMDPFDSYALLADKNYFFSSEDRVMVPYVLSGNFAVVLTDPIGHPDYRAMAIVDFVLYCRKQDWEPVFYAISSALIPLYEQAGFSLFKIGEGAHVRPADFHLKGGDFQNLRTLRHKAQKSGIHFYWYDASRDIDYLLERQLGAISQKWLKAKSAPEMSFDMGAYSLEDIRKNGAAVAIDITGRAIAFATWRPYAEGKGRALDLMRALPHARNVMDYILVESILRFRDTGVEDISLGLAPLANTEGGRSRLIAEEKMVQFLYENLNEIYGYKSLFEFKRKYRPSWHSRYVAYRRGVHLPFVGLALVRAHAPEGVWQFFIDR